MVYERYPRNQQGGIDGRDGEGYRRDQPYGASSARDYQAAGEYGARGGRERGYGGGYDRQGGMGGERDAYGARQGYGDRDRGYDRSPDRSEYRGSYASDGHRFESVGRYADADDDNYRGGRSDQPRDRAGYSRDDRGFFARAGDEVRSWFGDDDAERRREMDARYDERMDRQGGRHPDADYHHWRQTQIDALDRDYDEYRTENRDRFHQEFGSWRSERQGQRDSLGSVQEHMEVVGSDGQHVGTVDKVRGDRIILTKNDQDAGGRHHSIPSRWIQTVDSKVTLRKSSDEAKSHWRDEERNQAMFGEGRDAATGQASSTSATQVRDGQGRVISQS